MDAGLLQGQRSAGLQGRYTVADGFTALLAGHGLRAVRTANGTYALTRSTDPGPVELSSMTVTGDGFAAATTEGTWFCTTRAMSTATSLALSVRDTPQSVSVVTRQQIDDQDARSLTEVLRTTTSMAESAYDTERSSFSYRGFAVENYQYDGMPTTFSSPYAAGESDLDSVIYDRVEIVRGATGLMTGAGNSSAAIKLVCKRAFSDKLTGEVTASVDSWDNYRSTIDVSTPFNQDATMRGRFVAAGQQGNSSLDN
ncbi:TonB-dependent siderophore receptor [Achromobacter sp. DH1f]|uniref:TonB-dependent siderophore receptor n=1 Tax=Achromobacter sp. DH1f TaxID=1397275 RepID=UPI00068D93C3|nr:TonB-dependent receptor [Achromobacter sp. DH1f]